MKNTNRYASFLLRLWPGEPAEEAGLESWEGEVEHIQSGNVFSFIQLSNLPSFLRQIASEDRSKNSEENENEWFTIQIHFKKLAKTTLDFDAGLGWFVLIEQYGSC